MTIPTLLSFLLACTSTDPGPAPGDVGVDDDSGTSPTTPDIGRPDVGTWPGGGVQPPADHVWIFVFDGIRASESTEGDGSDPDAERAALQVLIDRSVLIPVLENRDATTTEAAHRTMVSGRRQPVSNFPWYEERRLQRGLFPTMFEEVAAQLVPGDSIVTGNTVFMDSQGSSLYPQHAGTGIPLEATDIEMAEGSDGRVMEQLAKVLTDDVRVTLVNLHHADKAAHSHKWEEYLNDIKLSLDHVLEFADTRTDSNDTFIAISDHGRHPDPDWNDHGDGCEGCRSSWMMAWGHGIDVEKGVVTDSYEMADVAPTVAHLLGIDLPSARGRVISEVLLQPPPSRDDALVDPSLVVTPGGVIHLLAEHLPGGSDGFEHGGLVYRRSDDGGATWTEEVFAQDDGVLSTPEEPQLLSVGDIMVRQWRMYSREELNWQIMGQTSQDAGLTWSPAQTLDNAVHHVANPGAAFDVGTTVAASMHSDQDDARTDGPSRFWLVAGRASATPVTWSKRMLDPDYRTESGSVHMPTAFDTATRNGAFVTVFAAVEGADYDEDNENREIFLARIDDLDSQAVIHQATDERDMSYWPDILLDGSGDGGWLAWSRMGIDDPDQRPWEVRVATSADLESWGEPLQITGDGVAWRPTLIATRSGPVLSWIEVEGTQHTAWLARLSGPADGTRPSLGPPLQLAQEDAMIERVALAVDEDGSLLASWHSSAHGRVPELSLVRVAADLSGVTEL